MRRAVLVWLILGACLAAGAPRAETGDTELRKVLAALDRTKDPKERLKHVRQLLAIQGPRATNALATLVRHDPSVGVRVGAARALGPFGQPLFKIARLVSKAGLGQQAQARLQDRAQ